MLSAPAVIIALVIGILCSVIYLRRRWKFEFARLEASLQHERYAGKIAVDFMHALSETFEGETGEHEVSKKNLFDSVLRTAIRGTRAKSACIFKANGSVLVPVHMSGLFPFLDGFPESLKNAGRVDVVRAVLKGKSYSIENSVFSPVISQRHSVLINAFPLAEDTIHLPNPPVVPRSLLAVPVFYENALVGLVAIANPRHGGQFTPAECHLAGVLGEQLAVALKMQKLFSVEAEKIRLDRELGLASSVQKLLLPQYIPQAHSLDISTVYRPAQQIGGDLYDIFDLGGGRIAAIVADVSGHGISAALLMAICRTNFQHVARNAITAADLLRRLNRAMMHSFKRGMFLTITCAFIDTQRNTLSIARGGHERPILVSNHLIEHGKTEIEFLDSKGLAIGISKPEVFDATITEVSRSYSRGDVLVFYTDGLTEALNAQGEEFGSARLQAVLESAHDASAEDINNAILRELTAFTEGSELSDDLTIVTIRGI